MKNGYDGLMVILNPFDHSIIYTIGDHIDSRIAVRNTPARLPPRHFDSMLFYLLIDELCKSCFSQWLNNFHDLYFSYQTDHGIGKCFPSDSHQLNLVRPFSASANSLRNKNSYILLVFK